MKQTVQFCNLSLGLFDSKIHVLYDMLSSQIYQMVSSKDLILYWYSCGNKIFFIVNDLDVTMQ